MTTQPTDAKTLGDSEQHSNASPNWWSYAKKCLRAVKNWLIGIVTILFLLLHFIENAWGEYLKIRAVVVAGAITEETILILIGFIAFIFVWATHFHHLVASVKKFANRLRRR